MVPNTFEAYTLSGAGERRELHRRLHRQDEDARVRQLRLDVHRSRQQGTHKGVGFAGVTWDFMKNGYVRVDEQYGTDLFNTIYVDGKYPIAIDAQTLLVLGAQYTSQKSIGKESSALLDLSRGPAGRLEQRPVRRPALLHAERQRLRFAESVRRPSVVPQPDAGALQYRRREGLGHRRQRQFRQPGRARAHRGGGLCEQQRPHQRRQPARRSPIARKPTCAPTTPSPRARRSRGWWPRCAAPGCIRTVRRPRSSSASSSTTTSLSELGPGRVMGIGAPVDRGGDEGSLPDP